MSPVNGNLVTIAVCVDIMHVAARREIKRGLHELKEEKMQPFCDVFCLYSDIQGA